MTAILLKQPEAVFIHIPKTAGRTVRALWGGDIKAPVSKGVMPDDWVNIYTFAFVRHPQARLISAYNMFSKGTKHIESGKVVSRRVAPLEGISFEGFVNKMFDEDDRDQQWSVTSHTLPMTDPYNLIQYADFVGKQEKFEHDMQLVAKDVGLRLDSHFPQVNVSEKDKSRLEVWADLPPALQAKVLDYYAEDFETFNYEEF
jgi:hypothetical protein